MLGRKERDRWHRRIDELHVVEKDFIDEQRGVIVECAREVKTGIGGLVPRDRLEVAGECYRLDGFVGALVAGKGG